MPIADEERVNKQFQVLKDAHLIFHIRRISIDWRCVSPNWKVLERVQRGRVRLNKPVSTLWVHFFRMCNGFEDRESGLDRFFVPKTQDIRKIASEMRQKHMQIRSVKAK